MILRLLTEEFAICQVTDLNQIDWSAPTVFVAKTKDELSVVCPSQFSPLKATQVEADWRGFQIEGTLDFALVGIVAGISSCLATENISVFVVSTFNTDYVLVKSHLKDLAIAALKREGYQIVQ